MWRTVLRTPPRLSGRERTFPDHEPLVTRTDPRGIVTCANRPFCEVSRHRPEEVPGRRHRIVRHPPMPACVFGHTWSQPKGGRGYSWAWSTSPPTAPGTGCWCTRRRCAGRTAASSAAILNAALRRLPRRSGLRPLMSGCRRSNAAMPTRRPAWMRRTPVSRGSSRPGTTTSRALRRSWRSKGFGPAGRAAGRARPVPDRGSTR